MPELSIVIKLIDNASSNLNKIESGLTKLARAATGIYALKKAFDFFVDSIKQAEEENEALRRVSFTLETMGANTKETLPYIQEWAKTLQETTRFSDEQAYTAFNKLARITGDVAVSQRLVSVAMGIASAGAMDYEEAVQSLALAYEGNQRGLLMLKKTFGEQLKDAKTGSDILNKLAGIYETSAQKEDSFTKSVNQLTNSFNEQKEYIGNFWIPIINDASKALTKFLKPEEGLTGINTALQANQLVYEATLKAMEQTTDPIRMQAIIKALEKINTDAMKIMQKKGTLPTEGKKEFEGKKSAEEIKANEDFWKKNEEMVSKFYDFRQEQRQMDFDFETTRLETEASLKEKVRQKEIEAERIKWESIYNIAGAASQAMTALGVASNSALLKSIGVVLNGIQTVINGVTTMLSGGVIGTILGILGIVTGTANVYSYFRQLDELQKENLELATAGISQIQTELPTTRPTTERATSVARQPDIVYNNYYSTYSINAGVMLGDESVIDGLFKKLMIRYNQGQNLTASGA